MLQPGMMGAPLMITYGGGGGGPAPGMPMMNGGGGMMMNGGGGMNGMNPQYTGNGYGY